MSRPSTPFLGSHLPTWIEANAMAEPEALLPSPEEPNLASPLTSAHGGAPLYPEDVGEPSSHSSTESNHTEATEPAVIQLRVGERTFQTTHHTLTNESNFFSAMLSTRWQGSQSQVRRCFVDADPDLFSHVLRYLRHGTFPVFCVGGQHDYGLYTALLGEARFYQIERLRRWLEGKEYLKAVSVHTTAIGVEGIDGLQRLLVDDDNLECHPFMLTKKVYVCPRNILVHRGNPENCGRQCRNAQGENGHVFEDEQRLQTLVLKRKTLFNPSMTATMD